MIHPATTWAFSADGHLHPDAPARAEALWARAADEPAALACVLDYHRLSGQRATALDKLAACVAGAGEHVINAFAREALVQNAEIHYQRALELGPDARAAFALAGRLDRPAPHFSSDAPWCLPKAAAWAAEQLRASRQPISLPMDIADNLEPAPAALTHLIAWLSAAHHRQFQNLRTHTLALERITFCCALHHPVQTAGFYPDAQLDHAPVSAITELLKRPLVPGAFQSAWRGLSGTLRQRLRIPEPDHQAAINASDQALGELAAHSKRGHCLAFTRAWVELADALVPCEQLWPLWLTLSPASHDRLQICPTTDLAWQEATERLFGHQLPDAAAAWMIAIGADLAILLSQQTQAVKAIDDWLRHNHHSAFRRVRLLRAKARLCLSLAQYPEAVKSAAQIPDYAADEFDLELVKNQGECHRAQLLAP